MRRFARGAMTALLGCAVFVVPLVAQPPAASASPLSTGRRVRVTLRPGRGERLPRSPGARVTGTFAEARGDTIVLQDDRAVRLAVATRDIQHMDVLIARESSVAGGAVAGLLLGALVGVVASPAEKKHDKPCLLSGTNTCEGWGTPDPQLFGAISGGVLGALAGGVIAATRRGRWVAYDVGSMAQARVAPGAHGVIAAIALRF